MILVLGKNGQLASHLNAVFDDAVFWGRDNLNLHETAAIAPAIIAARPQCIINTAAYTAVDAAESDPEAAWSLNAAAVTEIARAACELDVPLIHFSTDYVFPGDADRPYRETDPVGPSSVYGITKLAGELAVQTLCRRYWLFRTSWVFSEYGTNFVKTMLRLGSERDRLEVVDDQWGRPSYAGDIADVVARVVADWVQGRPLSWGVYHLASAGETNWYEFAGAVFECAQREGLLLRIPALDRISSREYRCAAPRPAYSVLDTSRIENSLSDFLPRWHEGLVRAVARLAASARTNTIYEAVH